MDPPDPTSVDDLFFDALDSFEDQDLNDDEGETLDASELIKTLDDSESQSNSNPNPSLDAPPPPPPFYASLRHRRLRGRRAARIPVPDDPPQPSTASTITLADSTLGQTTTTTPNSSSSSLLVSIACFVIKSILFQLNLILAFSLFPLKFACDPCRVVSAAINAVKERLLWVWNGFWGRMGLGKWAVRVCLGCFWSVYVGVVLVGILVVAFAGSGLVMRWIVEEPLRTVKELNFDYTKPSPDAVVEVRGGGGVDCVGLVGEHVGGKQVRVGGQRLELVVSLTLPESDYNRKLGMFQVRAEFISASGKVSYSSSQPCMLRFKSLHIKFVETFLKTGSLLAGYSSESQTLRIKMTGFTEGNDPIACIRVILEQRAEYGPGAGIPEIYAASIKLESQLPIVKRIIWNWRRTLFIWVGLIFFFLELFILLLCCWPLINPRAMARPSSETLSGQ